MTTDRQSTSTPEPETSEFSLEELIRENKELQSQLSASKRELKTAQSQVSQHQAAIDRLNEELKLTSTGDVEQIRQAFQAKEAAVAHAAGLAAFRYALASRGISPDQTELAEFAALRGGKSFALIDNELTLVDATGAREYDSDAKPLSPGSAAQGAIAKLGNVESKSNQSSLVAWGRDEQGRVIIPASKVADRREMRNIPAEDFDSGNIVIVPDAQLTGSQPTQPAPKGTSKPGAQPAGRVAAALQNASAAKTLEIRQSELKDTRSWCRQHGVDPIQFNDFMQSDHIRVVAG